MDINVLDRKFARVKTQLVARDMTQAEYEQCLDRWCSKLHRVFCIYGLASANATKAARAASRHKHLQTWKKAVEAAVWSGSKSRDIEIRNRWLSWAIRKSQSLRVGADTLVRTIPA